MTPDLIESLRALVAHLTAVVALCPLTDDDDKAELMRLAYRFNSAAMAAPHKED